MDTMRGNFSGHELPDDDLPDFGEGDDEPVRELPPAAIGQDERRMQVRAYNFWASLLADRNFPSIEDLEPEALPDFGPHSVLLDFSTGVENPAIQFLGDQLATECGADGPIKHLADVPSRSLLSRITDHYLQIIANQAPIGFEAEFVNQRGLTILYRGILLPFSSDDDTIDFIYGVINWKEIADQQTTDDLLSEIDRALEAAPDRRLDEGPLTDWADGPLDSAGTPDPIPADHSEDLADDWLGAGFDSDEPLELTELADDDWSEVPAIAQDYAAPDFAADDFAAEAGFELTGEMELSGDHGLADLLASAREMAVAARSLEDRSHLALYAAIGRAYDFSLAAAADPDGFAELAADAGLAMQDRAPLTPVVKLVFGADYDKTRLTEYAAVLGHAHRQGLAQGALSDYLAAASGGLKGIVARERGLRRGGAATPAEVRQTPRKTILGKLRKLAHRPLGEVAAEGSEFTLLVARRLVSGEVVLVGEVTGDAPLFEKAARKLLA